MFCYLFAMPQRLIICRLCEPSWRIIRILDCAQTDGEDSFSMTHVLLCEKSCKVCRIIMCNILYIKKGCARRCWAEMDWYKKLFSYMYMCIYCISPIQQQRVLPRSTFDHTQTQTDSTHNLLLLIPSDTSGKNSDDGSVFLHWNQKC